jgi:hypothetical protein
VSGYGLDADLARSHEAIGAWLGVGEERSRRIQRQALRWLREMAGPVSRDGPSPERGAVAARAPSRPRRRPSRTMQEVRGAVGQG